MNLQRYKTLVFDCDGVVLDSNKIKTRAFYQAALPYGEKAASALADYHIDNGGISRYHKFTYFLDNIVQGSNQGPDRKELLKRYASAVGTGLRDCTIVEGLTALRRDTAASRWLIASGGDQEELRQVFAERGIDTFFDGGIFGSPDSKDTILSRELANGTISKPGIFFGDSTYDHRAAINAGLDFVFVSAWSELKDWESYVTEHNLLSVTSLQQLTQSDQSKSTVSGG